MIGFLACKKPIDPAPPLPSVPDSKTVMSFSRTLNPNGHFIRVQNTYGTSGLIYQELSKDESTGQEMTQVYIYKNGIIHSSEISRGDKKLTKINYNIAEEKVVNMRYLEYDEHQNTTLNFERNFEYNLGILRKISTQNSDGSNGDYELFSFQGGNVTQIQGYNSSGQLLWKDVYDYDAKKNPYRGHPDRNQSAMGYSKSNIIKLSHTDYRNTNSSADMLYSYDYNINGLPTAVYLVNSNGERTLQSTYVY